MDRLPSVHCENDQTYDRSVLIKQRMAETIYITKPLVHLISMKCFGTTSWKQWMIPFALDLTR